MKILFVCPPHNNPGDEIIIEGTLNILGSVYKSWDMYFWEWEDGQEDYKYPDVSVDLVIICGSPWIWDGFENSVKYKSVLNILKYYKNTPSIFFGVGGCFNLSSSPAIKKNAAQELFGNSLVITRDPLANTLLNSVEVKNHLLSCPGFFCYSGNQEVKKDYNLMVYYEPTIGISHSGANKEFLNTYYKKFQDFYKENSPKVVVFQEEEVVFAEKLGFKNVEVTDGPTLIKTTIQNANKVLSGRVHAAIPAKALNKEVELIAVDTRALTFYNDISSLEDYSVLLKSFINGK